MSVSFTCWYLSALFCSGSYNKILTYRFISWHQEAGKVTFKGPAYLVFGEGLFPVYLCDLPWQERWNIYLHAFCKDTDLLRLNSRPRFTSNEVLPLPLRRSLYCSVLPETTKANLEWGRHLREPQQVSQALFSALPSPLSFQPLCPKYGFLSSSFSLCPADLSFPISALWHLPLLCAHPRNLAVSVVPQHAAVRLSLIPKHAAARELPTYLIPVASRILLQKSLPKRCEV